MRLMQEGRTVTHVSGNKILSNDIINPGDMLSSKCKIKTKCLKSDQPYKVHHTGNFGALGRQNSNDSLVVTVEANSPTLTQRGAQIVQLDKQGTTPAR